jgi:hypothetical protein
VFKNKRICSLFILCYRRATLNSRLAHLITHQVQLVSVDGSEVEQEILGLAGLYEAHPVYVKQFATGVTLNRLTHDTAFANGLVTVSVE